MSGQIDKYSLGRISDNLISFLQDNPGLSKSNPSIKELVSSVPLEFIDVSMRDSNLDTQALAIGYIIPGIGMPIEVRINRELGYCRIIIKADFNLPAFIPFGMDNFGNIVQGKKDNYRSLKQVINSLQFLFAELN